MKKMTVDESGGAKSKDGALLDKLLDILNPGYQSEMEPDEADAAGAFLEDAISEDDALDSDADLLDAISSGGEDRDGR